jgi:uncharacterized protein (TIGR00255 family)
MEEKMRSMTGFGRAEVLLPIGKLVLEISSINRKYLDVTVHLPKELSSFEMDVRSVVGKKVSRGQLTLRYTLYAELKSQSVLPDPSLVKKMKSGWEKIAEEVGLSKKDVDLTFIAQQFQKLSLPVELKDASKCQTLLESCTVKALDALIKMKVQEGKALAKDIVLRLKNIEKELAVIEKKAPIVIEKLKAKMLAKIAELFPNEADNQDRILREVVIYSEKADITEEIVRVKSHIKQFIRLLSKPDDAPGRKMDFLIQELMRETNTIGSKSSDMASSTVEIKSELEKIREQIQNIE